MNALEALHAQARPAGFDHEELVATTLTLMTAAYAQAYGDIDEPSLCSRIADRLRELAARDDASQEFRDLCSRLQRLWRRAAADEDGAGEASG